MRTASPTRSPTRRQTSLVRDPERQPSQKALRPEAEAKLRSPELGIPQKLILASASPRRREILAAAGIEFRAVPAPVPERQKKGESPREFVCRLAAAKARAARALLTKTNGRGASAVASAVPDAALRDSQYADSRGPQNRLPILGADTVVVLGDQIFGKPASAADARRMLRLLSGRRHQVLTGLCLLYPSAQPAAWVSDVRTASTTVKLCSLTAEEIEQYIATGEPLDKAGAYAIQGRASRFVEWIEGCYFNVVGLPVSLLNQMLKNAAQRRYEVSNLRAARSGKRVQLHTPGHPSKGPNAKEP